MTSSQQRVERFLQYFSAGCKTPIHLKDGVCALYNEQDEEAAVLEVPQHSDSLLLHCRIIEADPQTSITLYSMLLQLNFEMAAMRGCWLALDELHNVRLCFQQSLEHLDEASFSDIVSGFIEHAAEVREYIAQLDESSAA
ncbi:type III secretion system chaperone [Erwinia amylovora]|uniref:Hrp secreted pathogenicity-related protein n=8 Tax=Erwinia amylovora TaxID=552 RepID=A0A831A3C1_ERWAM|nr:type III secretion system chaperone [Erwinia amylovora]CBX79376.1 Hrp secreted pathogenicity-related protein [Erwinia amylovora ATCC BAA-2158]CDK14157.1 Hrp secreted pathogenicity-related protein [Erwinia amylovora LA635]CDK17524.1 Hrp secreted pathogenicity-related protein [Erwinia amylovora LA636]CDK20893.1 Hrp secreted pathogenicity-related protein [Erwinia amylovora LA637]AAC04851.1 DspF [Erwinia amylovora]